MSAAASRAALDRVAVQRQELGSDDFAAYSFLVLAMLAYHAPEVVVFVMDRADEHLADAEGLARALQG